MGDGRISRKNDLKFLVGTPIYQIPIFMKKLQFRTAILAFALMVAGATTLLNSCQSTENIPETEAQAEKKAGMEEMKSFEIALKNLNSKGNRDAKAVGYVAGTQAVKKNLIQESKDLIYSTGLTENELLVQCGNDDEKIISMALQIHDENANGKLKL